MYFFLIIIHSVLCQEPFGTILGKNKEVIAYSNNAADSNPQDYHYDNYINDIFSGLKYECVEYARRWLISVKNLTFPALPCASDIWHLNQVSDIYSENSVKLLRIQNGAKCPPEPGDLLIYAKNPTAPYGHVAVVVSVGKDYIKIAEQNWDNEIWPGDYARKVKVVKAVHEVFVVDEGYAVTGWMRYQDQGVKDECVDKKCETCTPPDPSKFCDYF